MGANGTGKSSFMDALLYLRRLVVIKQTLDRHDILSQRTLWLNLPKQTFEIEAALGDAIYAYRLVIEAYGDPAKPRVESESVKCNGNPIFDFQAGEVQLFDDEFQRKIAYPYLSDRSALATVETKDNRKLIRFKNWFRHLLCFRINPFAMESVAKGEDTYPFAGLSNFAAWYRHLLQSAPKENTTFLKNLREALDGFNFLEFGEPIENQRLMSCEFGQKNGPDLKLSLNQLSDGQRCLLGLYSILHFVAARGHTVVLDEPDNFIALREIQPWLSAVSDAVDDGNGQVLIISHHPELLDQWAPNYGVQFVRDGIGPVRVKEFQADPKTALSPSELVARGWENE